jgi:protein associated with RNAse G/E
VKKRQKYGNKKIVVNGIKFDSKLEQHCHGYLELIGADFDFQQKITLIEPFRFNDKAVRATTLIIDFIVRHNGKTIYLDTKGFATDVAKLKFKLLKVKLRDEENVEVVWLKNKNEVNRFINSLID